MFDTSILELVIGLLFIFSLMAILVTQINTLVTNAWNLRAVNLKESLQELVGDRVLQAEVLVHPLIKLVDPEKIALVSLRIDDEIADMILSAPLTRVSDISSDTFVEALVSILTVRAFGPLERALQAMDESEQKQRILALLGDLHADPSEERMAALRQGVAGLSASAPDTAPVTAAFATLHATFEQIRTRGPELRPLLIGVSRIKTPPFREAMQIILYSAKTLPDATVKLQQWFNDGMQRSSAMFREKLQKLSLIVACVMVLLMNVDTLSITQSLWDDHGLRADLAAAARLNAGATDATDTGSVIENALGAQATAQQLIALNVPLGWSYMSLSPQMVRDAAALGLPDPYGDTNNLWNLWPPNGNPSWFTLLLAKVIGLAASAIAAAQGAPFWFDLLQKITRRT